MAWINKGENEEEQYHVLYGVDGAERTQKARSVHGRGVLTAILTSDLHLVTDRVNKVLDDLETMGTCSIMGLNIPDADLKRLDLA
jgi:hypothetical protein